MSSILRNNERKQIKRDLSEISTEDIIKELRKRSNKEEDHWALIWVDIRTLAKSSQNDKEPEITANPSLEDQKISSQIKREKENI